MKGVLGNSGMGVQCDMTGRVVDYEKIYIAVDATLLEGVLILRLWWKLWKSVS